MTHMLGIINNFFTQERYALDASREVENDHQRLTDEADAINEQIACDAEQERVEAL
jgi:hypothetical protein